MMQMKNRQTDTTAFEGNLKKALTEMIMLFLLSEKDCFIGELTAAIKDRSGEKLNIVFPYGAVYRMQNDGLIEEVSKQKAPDGRKRQYYRITELGRSHLKDLLEAYHHFTQGVSAILATDQ